jgi:predicted phosphodiesterase
MRTLVLSDLHSNHEATLAVLESARSLAFDRVAVLGDLVGYGADPNEVVKAIRDLSPFAVVRGNHDKVVAGIDPGEDFNRVAAEAARINRLLLLPENAEYLFSLPQGPGMIGGTFAIAHGTPLDEDEYLADESGAAEIFGETGFSVCFFGHTHVAGAFALKEGAVNLFVPGRPEAVLRLEAGARYLINPGSVGQPRDSDPRASFAIYDEAAAEVIFRRVDYPIERARQRIQDAGLPGILGERLLWGV